MKLVNQLFVLDVLDKMKMIQIIKLEQIRFDYFVK
jgi:hypothetical protein